jgi:HlyD family secretion protein
VCQQSRTQKIAYIPVFNHEKKKGEYFPVKKIAIVCLILAAFTAGLFFFFKTNQKGPEYVTQVVDRGDIRASVSATGTVNAITTVSVGTQVSGSIQALFVDFNSRVVRGQLLAQIDPSTFEAQVAQARANLMLAEANLEKAKVAVRDAKITLERNKILFGKNFIAKSDLDTSETNYLSAQAQVKASSAQVEQTRASLNLAQTHLRYTRILSPVNGTVISRSIDVGQTVAASFQTPTLFSIAQDLTKMQINTDIDEADIGRIQMNQPVTFTVDAYPEITFHGKVSEIRNAPTTVQNVVTYDVMVNVDNPDLKLKPGMTTNVSIVTDNRKNVLRVPNAALRVKMPDTARVGGKPPKGTGVWILEHKKPRRILLSLGISDNKYTEVISGKISERDHIIVEVKSNQQKSNSQSAPPPGPRF